MGQRLQPGPELARGPPHPLGHGPHLAVLLGHEHDDAIGLAEAVGAQHHAGVSEQAHRSPASPRGAAGAGGAGPAGGGCHVAGPARALAGPLLRLVDGPVLRLLGRADAGGGHGPVRVLAVEEVAAADEADQGHDGDHRGEGAVDRRWRPRSMKADHHDDADAPRANRVNLICPSLTDSRRRSGAPGAGTR